MKEKFEYNPFSGVLEDDLAHIIVPIFDVTDMSHKIENADSLAIEFIGKQGRGKTTHLRYLQHQLKMYPIFLLSAKQSSLSDILNHASDVVFVDSIHHLSFLNRLQLFKSKRVVVYTTHWSRKYACTFTGKKHHSIQFKGITVPLLKSLLHRRLQLSAKKSLDVDDIFTTQELHTLIKKFGDNYRGIINHLYEIYQ